MVSERRIDHFIVSGNVQEEKMNVNASSGDADGQEFSFEGKSVYL